MSDYRGDLYRNIILNFYKQKHRPPYVEELKSLGVKELYFKRSTAHIQTTSETN